MGAVALGAVVPTVVALPDGAALAAPGALALSDGAALGAGASVPTGAGTPTDGAPDGTTTGLSGAGGDVPDRSTSHSAIGSASSASAASAHRSVLRILAALAPAPLGATGAGGTTEFDGASEEGSASLTGAIGALLPQGLGAALALGVAVAFPCAGREELSGASSSLWAFLNPSIAFSLRALISAGSVSRSTVARSGRYLRSSLG